MKITSQAKENFLSMRTFTLTLIVFGIAAFGISRLVSAGSAPTLAISQSPLTVAIPSHPQVLIAIANSQSMDGTLSGAIMTGSGSLPAGMSTLNASSSPVNYTTPAGFTPPVTTTGVPYTATSGLTLVDNGASRLNVAKAGLSAIINTYMTNTDFAIEDYSTTGTTLYNTWVYYMSLSGGFTFANAAPSSGRYVNNPCYGYTSGSTTVKSNCTSIASLYGSVILNSNQYMTISASSDDPNINDVLYASSSPAVFINYGGPNVSSPYPPSFTLANYNSGGVSISYSNVLPLGSNSSTGPTNAGYVPYSNQVMYSQRGFGYYSSSQSATTGNIAVAMTTAGANSTSSSVATAVAKFTPYIQPETNSTLTTEIKSSATQAPTAGLLTKALSYLNTTVSSGSNPSCHPKQYVVLLTDGLPTEDMNGKSWPPLGSAAGVGYGVTASFNTDGSLATTNDQALQDTITALKNLNAAGIKTYIVGLGAGVDPTNNPQAAATLAAMAVAGGAGNYYPATSPTALVNDFNNIMLSVQAGDFTTSAPAVSSTILKTGTADYQASFNTKDSPYQDWTGDLIAVPLNPLTGVSTGTPSWSLEAQLDLVVNGTGGAASRFIATWDPNLNNSGVSGPTPFEWASISSTLQSNLQPSDTLGSSRLQYLRGNPSLEVRNGGTFRNRTHALGDIVDSSAVYVGAPSDAYFISSYSAFQSAQASRQPMLYVGANDGMLHAVNATNGKELFAFIPNGVFANLYNLSAPTYNQNHRFFVDGSPQSSDVQFSDGSWHTILTSGENGGGKTIFAMDITNPQNITNETTLSKSVLWEFSDVDMGLSYSTPKAAEISNATGNAFAVFFGNGYNSTNNNAVLYAVNPQTGQVITKINLCSAVPGVCNSSLSQGLSSVSVGNSDGSQGQPITQVYAGDLQGNMWAVDVSNSDPTLWTPRLLFQARDASNNPQPITTPPLVTLNPKYPRKSGLFVMFGTGQLLTLSDLTSTQYQSIYGVWDRPSAATFMRSDLQQQTLTLVTAATSGLPQDILLDTKNSVDLITKFGWYIDMLNPGQRTVTDPKLNGGAYLTTLNTPPSNSCTGLFSSMFLELNYANGGAFLTPQLDINGSMTINAADAYNGNDPVGVGLPSDSGFASSPIILTTGKYRRKLITTSVRQLSVLDPRSSPIRSTWLQLQ